jgi:hypothetical protein
MTEFTIRIDLPEVGEFVWTPSTLIQDAIKRQPPGNSAYFQEQLTIVVVHFLKLTAGIPLAGNKAPSLVEITRRALAQQQYEMFTSLGMKSPRPHS